MRFLSLFSGIEAASCAWIPLGWEAVAFAEIEKFPCAVLANHYPAVTNLGDVSKITQQQIEALGRVDITVGGFPCQDLSVAGKRKGLKNADGTITRSGLFFNACQIADWSKSRFTLIENVPGLFSSNEGRDFAAVVGELAGAEFDVPRDGWRNAGVALGPKGLVEWCVLDAQYFGVAQRRKRIFIVRDSGDWANRPPLFLEPKSLRWNPPPSRAEGEGITHSTCPSLTGSGRGVSRTGESRGQDPVIPIQEIGKRQSGSPMNGVGHGQPGDPMFTLQAAAVHGVASTLRACSSTKAGHNARAGDKDENLVAFQPRIGRNGHSSDMVESGLINALNSQATGCSDAAPCVAFRTAGNCGPFEQGDKTAALNTATDPNQNILVQQYAVRRLTPTECERLQGFPDDYTAIQHRNKLAADGPRYKALGNSMAVPVIRWIGQRIELVHNLK